MRLPAALLCLALALPLGLGGCAGSGDPRTARIDGGAAPSVQAALARLPPGPLTCVPFARELSGIRISGDAHTWWGQAARLGYRRGQAPRPGAVLVFARTRRLASGHLSVVTHRLAPREILVTHANWGDSAASRGRIDQDVRVIDVSPGNDWTAVRVWHAPSRRIGITVYRTDGFIYAPADTTRAELSEAVERAAWAAQARRPGRSSVQPLPSGSALPLPPRPR